MWAEVSILDGPGGAQSLNLSDIFKKKDESKDEVASPQTEVKKPSGDEESAALRAALDEERRTRAAIEAAAAEAQRQLAAAAAAAEQKAAREEAARVAAERREEAAAQMARAREIGRALQDEQARAERETAEAAVAAQEAAERAAGRPVLIKLRGCRPLTGGGGPPKPLPPGCRVFRGAVPRAAIERALPALSRRAEAEGRQITAGQTDGKRKQVHAHASMLMPMLIPIIPCP